MPSSSSSLLDEFYRRWIWVMQTLSLKRSPPLRRTRTPSPPRKRTKTPSPKSTTSPPRKGCPAGKIMNPETGRCVNRDGKVGRKIQEEKNKRSPMKNKSQQRKPQASPPRDAPDEENLHKLARMIACEPVLTINNIKSKKDYYRFALENHTDKTQHLSPRSRTARENALKEVTACKEFL